MNVVSDDPKNTQYPDQFSIGDSDNEPGKLQIHFDDLLVQGLQKDWSCKVKKQEKMERRRWTLEGAGTSEDHHQDKSYGALTEKT